MSRQRRARRYPSYRNLQIYHEVAYEGRTQTAVAAEFALSQRRVSAIARQVGNWVDCLVRPREYVGRPGWRFHLALLMERLRLHDANDPVLQLFTDNDGRTRFLKQRVTVVGGQPLHTVEITEEHNQRLFDRAADVQGRLAELEAVAARGPFADLGSCGRETIVRRYAEAETAISSSSKTRSSDAENRGRGVLSGAEFESPAGAELAPVPEVAECQATGGEGQSRGAKRG